MEGKTRDARLRERGVGALEYVGIALLAGIVLASTYLVVRSTDVTQAATVAYCKITSAGGGDCEEVRPSGDSDSGDTEYGGFGTEGEDPGDDVEYPEGLDPDSDIAKELASTERGRRILQWLHDNNIEVVIDPGATGAYYSNGVMTLGPGHQEAGTVIHEANHAVWDKEGRHADASSMSKDDYVSLAIEEEAEGVWLEVVYAKERRDAGETVSADSAEQRYDGAYQTAYDAAIASGDSVASAHAAGDRAGRDAIEQMFYDGTYVTSNTGDPYSDYYGDYWESVN